MKKSETIEKKVTAKSGEVFTVNISYELEYATREQPEDFEFEINGIYDEDGFEVTQEIQSDLYAEIESLAIEGI